MDAPRRVTRAFSAQKLQEQQQNESPQQSAVAMGEDGEGLMTVSWPENGALTLEWVQKLGKTLDFASRNLLPSELPTVLPVSVIDSLLLAAHKVSEVSSFRSLFSVTNGGEFSNLGSMFSSNRAMGGFLKFFLDAAPFCEDLRNATASEVEFERLDPFCSFAIHFFRSGRFFTCFLRSIFLCNLDFGNDFGSESLG